jgi:hypothetical protein
MKSRFIESTPKFMRCADKLGTFSSLERKDRALASKYVSPNSAAWIGWQFFDIDRAGAADTFDEANVAVPNVIVENPANGHAHYGYALEVPVSNGVNSRKKPMAYLKAIRAGMVRRMGADPNFRFGLNKNPLHGDWRTTWLTTKPYALNDMAVFLDTEEMQPIRRGRDTEYAELGRNCALTSDLAKFGLRNGWRMQRAGFNHEAFLRELRAQAFELNNAFAEPLGYREVQSVARSVGKWAWSESTFEKFSEIQTWRAEIRSRRNWAILEQVPDLASKSTAEVAEILGRSERTARRYVAQPRAEYEASSTERAAPWAAMGISRRTYYRQKAAGKL